MAAVDFLKQFARLRRVTVDTNCCIYHLEAGAKPERRAIAAKLFELSAGRELAIDLPGIVRLEMLVHPLRHGDQVALAKVRRFSDNQPGVTSAAVSERVLFDAARVRALTGLKTPDALVVASAIAHGSEAIVGNDGDFRRLNTLNEGRTTTLPRYIHMDDYAQDA